ncbi:hypothetical protein AB835_05850 [Candidatus Endobugula sertula]|uniref:Band 7 domain-containing protein n=1 Tax=Candidatus Endobugula sertula TaxID=62101 RepID=A0A1D2QR31_9GAMM|nr:hypothetical protein AB835_05850 [Candidatus Endobugula sertula]
MFWKTIDIADHQRALLYVRDQFKRVLGPGRHRVSTPQGRVAVDVHDITDVLFKNRKAQFLMTQYADKLAPYLEQFNLKDSEVGLLYRDNKLASVLAPGSVLTVWKNVEDVRVDIIDISENYQIDKSLINLLGRGLTVGQSREVVNAILYAEVPDEHVGLLNVNGKLESILKPGNYGFWKYNRSVGVKLLDLRLQAVEVSGQKILTKDRVSLRINLSASYKVKDPEIVALKVNDYAGFIYRELQLSLREAVGTQSLDTLLEDKDTLNTVITQATREKLANYGIELVNVGVKDIILPGDMKQILNQVVEAQKEAEANLIKRREETQAMRSLHNTAKMMENNPVLLRLKELEALEKITGQIDKISVYGGLGGVLNELVTLAPKKA